MAEVDYWPTNFGSKIDSLFDYTYDLRFLWYCICWLHQTLKYQIHLFWLVNESDFLRRIKPKWLEHQHMKSLFYWSPIFIARLILPNFEGFEKFQIYFNSSALFDRQW